MDIADKANWTLSTFNACYNHSDTITGGTDACSISKLNWAVVDTLFTSVNDNSSTNVTKANLDTLFGIDSSTYSIDLSYTPNLQYTQNCITALTTASSSSIKSCVTAATQKVAAKWKVYQVSRGHDNTTHPLTDFTVTLYDKATSDNGTAFLQDVLDARPSLSLTDLRNSIRTYFPSNTITDASNDTAFKQFPVVKAGFKGQMTSYNAWVVNAGFSVSSVNDASEDIVRVWEACRRSRDTLSGGSTNCTPTYAAWAARAADRASNNIVQARHNDMSGPRVYTETLMGVTFNLKTISTAYSTEWQWIDSGGTSQTKTIGWTSSNGSYAFFDQSTTIAQSPPIGALIAKQ